MSPLGACVCNLVLSLFRSVLTLILFNLDCCELGGCNVRVAKYFRCLIYISCM